MLIRNGARSVVLAETSR